MKKFYSRGGGGGWKGDRAFGNKPSRKFEATCGACGAECEVPFRPTGDRPVYCSACFQQEEGGNRRFDQQRRGPSSFGSKPMFPAKCDACGNACQVPFRPTGEKPVYCSDCFGRQAPSERKSGFGEKRDDGGLRKELATVQSKLDAILAILQPSMVIKTEKKEKIVEAKKEVAPAKKEVVETKKEEVPLKKEAVKKASKKKSATKKKK